MVPLMLSTNTQSSSNRSGDSAGVLVELTFVLPVMIFLIAAVFSTGRIIGQIAWMSQTAFQTYLIGAEYLTDAERILPMDGRSVLLDDTNSALSRNAFLLDTSGQPFMTFNYDPGEDSLSTTITGNLETIFGANMTFELNFGVTGALLAVDGGVSTPLNVFLNPAPLYSCSGLPCTGTPGCGTTPCI